MRSLSVVIGTLALVSLGPRLTLAGTICSSSPPPGTTWIGGNSNWNSAGNWDSGVPNGTTNACITDGSSTVALDITTGAVASLQLNSSNALNFNQGSQLIVNGPQLVNAGAIQVNGGGNSNTYLYALSSITLSGAGTLTLSTTTSGGGGSAYLWLYNSGITLDNVDNTIQGEGYIYNSGTTIINQTGGTINANSTGSPLVNSLQLWYGTVNNAGLMEATNNGTLQLYSTTVNNSGGSIAANGSGASVPLYNTTILGGTLNNNGGAFLGTPTGYSATLDGSTTAGAVTLNGGYTSDYGTSTYLYGSIINNNNLQVNGGANSNTYLYLNGGNLTLTGGGTLSLSTTTNGGGGNAWLYLYNGATLDNVNNTIQGEGIIYNASTTLNNHAGGTINANSTGFPLVNTLNVQYGTVNNQGVMEATNNGELQLYGTTVNNSGGGSISANGPGASVKLYNTTILGGTLNNNSGASFGTPTGYSATLDGSTAAGPITLNGTYTSDFNTTTYLYGSIINNNNLQVNGGANSNTYLYLNGGNPTLTGGGTLSLYTTTFGGGGNAYLYLYNGATLDNVDNTIQGEGIIYNGGTTLINEAGNVINANSTGSPLASYLSVQFGTVNNQGVMKATNNGTLELYYTTVNNSGGGSIAANGPGTSVKLYNTTIQGGTLNNNGGAFFGTPYGNVAYLDGSTAAGAITLTGTYTSDYNTNTYLYGTINNQGNLLVNGGGNTNTYLEVPSDVTLTGGGTVSLNTTTSGGSGSAYLYLYNSATLDNVNNTIQGEGIISNGGSTLINEAGGTILANSTGSPLTDTMYIDNGTVTNHGTMEVNNGATMDLYYAGFTTDGNVTINSGGDFIINTTYSQTGGTTQVDGTLNASAGVNVTGGTVDGTGTIIGSVSLTNATMQPGDAPGTLNIVGDYSMTGGEFIELIDGVSNGLLSVSGTLTLGPGVNLDIDLLPGFTSTIGQQFTILEFLSGGGLFANTPGGIFNEDGYLWSVAYNANNVILTLDSAPPSTVPEPSSLILMATALGAILASGKLRRAKR